MELIVRRNGEEVRVAVERQGDEHVVRLGERVLRVERVVAAGTVRSLLIDGRQHEVSVRTLGDGRYRVEAGSGEETVEVLDPLTHPARATHAASGAGGPSRVAAYMPGRVVAVLVAEGDAVTRGQGLVVLEAMKMENEIQAESDGVVTRIHVAPGQAVEGGDPLFEIG